MSTEKVPPRLHVIIAQESPVAAVIRRGKSSLFALIKWNMDTDEFVIGQWFKGRIYPLRSDLSHDGKYLIYFAAKFARLGDKMSWTAVSELPYWTARDIYFGDSAWNGGGLFLKNRMYWYNKTWYSKLNMEGKKSTLEMTCEFPFEENYGGECPGVYFPKLMKYGWTMPVEDVFWKKLPNGWTMVKKFSYKDKRGYCEENSLINPGADILLDKRWDWTDWDPFNDRLIWVDRGCIFAAKLSEAGLGDEKILYDFNDMEFQEVSSPYTTEV